MNPQKLLTLGFLSASLTALLCSCTGGDGTYLPAVATPSHLHSVGGDGKVTVSWHYPPGSAQTFKVGYTSSHLACPGYFGVPETPGQLCHLGCTTQDTICTVTGLTNGIVYEFTVNAIPPKGVDSTYSYIQSPSAIPHPEN